MKLKPGNVILNHRALVKIALILFLCGIMVGVKIAMLEGGKRMSLLPFIPIYAIIIPALWRSMRKDIDGEQM